MKLLILCVIFLCSSALGEDHQQQTHKQNPRRSAVGYTNYQPYGNVANTTSMNDQYIARIYERTNSILAQSQHISKKLDDIDYKVARIEIENKNTFNEVKNALGHDETSSVVTLSLVKREIEEMRRDLTKRQVANPLSGADISSNPDCSDKITAVATLLTSTRVAVSQLQTEFMSISANMSHLLALSSEIHKRQHTLPTKQYLNGVLHSTRGIPPLYGIVNNPSLPGGQVRLPPSCAHISSTGNENEIQRIQVNPAKSPFYVICDQSTQDGGWTVIQHRHDGSINFNRNWLEYKNGFGNIAGEFFIGLDKLHDITSSGLHELLIIMEDFDNVTKYARYSAFAIGEEKEDYAITVLGGYEGDAGDSLYFSASYKFSTFDNDNDGWIEGNCAQAHTGAWWYNACEMSNLNGQYLGSQNNGKVSSNNRFQGIYWTKFRGPDYSLKTVKMMIRPVDRSFLPID